MKHWYHKPNKQLENCVSTILIMEGFSESDTNSLPIFTNGLPTLLCRTEKDPAGHENIVELALFNKSTGITDWKLSTQTTIIVYFFKPFEMTCLFNIAAKELSETAFDLSRWNPLKCNALRTQLTYARATDQKIEILNHLLLKQLKENQKVSEIIRYATDRIMFDSGTEILTEILDKLKLNERTFQRLFKKYVGVTPTQYRRVCQFQLSFGQLHSNQFEKISDVAFDSGFSDQSHFIRSFKEFTAITPNDYLKKGLKGKKQ